MKVQKIQFQRIALLGALAFLVTVPQNLYAERVSGGGYTVEQIIAPIQGAISGNGFTLQQSSQISNGAVGGGGYTTAGFSGSSGAVATTPTVTTPTTPVASSGGTNGGGFYVLPPSVTGQIPATTTPTNPNQNPGQTSTSSPTIPVTPEGITLSDTISTCPARITFSGPIDVGVTTNKSLDVRRLEIFLNTYENEKLPVNGIYEARDIAAVKRWQLKYKTFILDPMQLKNPTGTIYTLSMRQIERQTTKACGEAITVTACPLFRTSVSYGNRGEEVRKVQQFLNVVQGEKLPLSGVFGPLTRDAVKRFQRSRKIYVATFIPFSYATGNWFTTTRIKANETIGCDILK